MTQNILSAMSSDVVNSIFDTVESLQVAQIIQNKYYDIVARGDLTLDEQLFQLEPSNNPFVPVILRFPAGVTRIDWLQYMDTNPLDNTQTDQFGAFSHDLDTDLVVTAGSEGNSIPGYKYIPIVPIDYFLDITNRMDVTQSNVIEYGFDPVNLSFGFSLRAMNDRQPTLATAISNQYILFDSYDKTQDGTIQASKTMAYGQVVPVFELADGFIPTLDDNQFPLLLNESKSLAFYELKQMPHQKADEEIKRQWTVTQARKSKANKPSFFDALSNFGRVPRTGGYGGYPLWRFMRNSSNFNSSI